MPAGGDGDAAGRGDGNGNGNGNGNGARPASDWRRPADSRRRTPAHVLVVANETVGGQKLIEAIERRAARGPIRVHRRLPAEHSRARAS